MSVISEPYARSCVSCGGAAHEPLYRELVTCMGCGMVYYPRPLGAGEAEQLYDDGYFQGEEYFDYLADRAAHAANFRRRARQLLRWLPAGRQLFEIGCAYGLFLEQARTYWKARGCDLAPGPCRHAREELGLDVYCGDFLDVPILPGEVDAFCLWDTIEHLNDPGAYLTRAAELLAPGGVLALTTGDIGSLLARWQGPSWRQVHPPTHIWYFSRETIRRTLERFGFEVVSIGSVGMARSVGQVVYSLTQLGRRTPARLHTRLLKSPLGRVCFTLNTHDLMFVVARRNDVVSGSPH